MITLTERLRAVQEQVTRLVREHQALHGKLAQAESEAQEHRRTVDLLKVRVAELERENEVLRKSKGGEGRSGDPGTKERIDELVHEIDRCLALING